MADSYLGDVRAMSFGFAPRNWAPCDGRHLPISQNQALFSLLGFTYGGDGQHDFALPKLAGVPAENGATLNYCICIMGSYPPQ